MIQHMITYDTIYTNLACTKNWREYGHVVKYEKKSP